MAKSVPGSNALLMMNHLMRVPWNLSRGWLMNYADALRNGSTKKTPVSAYTAVQLLQKHAVLQVSPTNCVSLVAPAKHDLTVAITLWMQQLSHSPVNMSLKPWLSVPIRSVQPNFSAMLQSGKSSLVRMKNDVQHGMCGCRKSRNSLHCCKLP